MKKSSLTARKAKYGWIFISPFLLGFIVLYTRVFINSIIFSFNKIRVTDVGYSLEFKGWEYYHQALFVNTDFNKTVISSVRTMLVNVPVILIFSLFIAVLLNDKFKGRGIYRAIFFLPVILATGIIAKAESNNAIIGDMWSLSGIDMGTQSSGASSLVNSLDIQNFLLDLNINSSFTEYVVSAANNIYNILNMSGVQILIFLAGLQSIPDSIYESARIEGATEWEAFWKITFPMVSPLILLNLIYSIIDSFTSSQNELMKLIDSIGLTNTGMASSMAWIYTVLSTILIIISLLIASKFVFYQQKR